MRTPQFTYQDNKFNGAEVFDITGPSTSVTELAASIKGS